MGFTIEDRHLIKCLQISNSYVAANLCYVSGQWTDNEILMK